MDVACSTLCFTRESFETALRRIAEFEFARVDLAVADGSPHLTPRMVVENQAAVLHRIRQGPTIGFAAITYRGSTTGAAVLEEIDALAHLAKQLAAPVVAVDAAAVGADLDAEVARLSEMEKRVSLHGAILAVTTRIGTLTEDPDIAVTLCERVRGLGLALDISHFMCGPHHAKSIEPCFAFTRHVHFRDSGKTPDKLQVTVGQGHVDFSRVIAALTRFDYKGSLTVSIEDTDAGEMDVDREVRKLRLLLESLL